MSYHCLSCLATKISHRDCNISGSCPELLQCEQCINDIVNTRFRIGQSLHCLIHDSPSQFI